MHPDLAALSDVRAARRVAGFLDEVPWGWPSATDAAYTRALEATGVAAPRPLSPGEALLLTERSGAGSLWALRLGANDGGDVALDATGPWLLAASLLPGSLPYLWRSPRPRDPRSDADPLRPLPAVPPRLPRR